MIAADLTPWTAGFQAGYPRGRQDATAELLERTIRDPEHRGHPGEPPEGADPHWVDGFLEGYASGRRDILGGAA